LFDPYIGNKDLDPEKSITYEGGVEFYPMEKMRLRVTDFYGRTKNAIQFVITDPVFYLGQYKNSREQKNYGAEVELNYEGKRWNLAANYTYTRGRVQSAFTESGSALSKDTTYHNLYRVPEHAVNAFITYMAGPRLSVSTLVKYAGKRWEPVYLSAPKQLDDYLTIDLSGLYRIGDKYQFFADLKNITDRKYFEVLGYNARRFNFTTGLRVQW
jgi:vitamin B12 transporter